MGMDVYAGTFTRYYARNWKTASQKFCEENGIAFRQIRTDSSPPPPVEEIMDGVNDWQNRLVEVLHNSGVPAAEPWEENNEKPYYTDKPDWDAFGALALYAASKLLDKKTPKDYPKGMDYNSHPLMRKISKSSFGGLSLFSGVYHWIPVNDSIMFKYPLVNGITADIGTTTLLKSELIKINELGWKEDRNTILGWSNTEGYPQDASFNNGRLEIKKVTEVYDTHSLAKFAFSVLWRAAEFAENERVPVILDY